MPFQGTYPQTPPFQNVTTRQTNTGAGFRGNQNVTSNFNVTDEKSLKANVSNDCHVVTDENRGTWGNGDIYHEKTQEVTALIESILNELGKPITVGMVLNELVPDDYQYLINDPNYARGFVKTLSERLAP